MRCCFAKNFEEIIPTLANNIMAKGISKIKPNGNKKAMTKKKEKAKPAKNKISEIGTITEIKYLSIPIKAGKTNRHI